MTHSKVRRPAWTFLSALFMLAMANGSATGAETRASAAPGDAGNVAVTVDNFVRAATDLEMAKYDTLAGGINRFAHFRQPTPVEQQPTIRMNRDTLYSFGVIDISEGATLIMPEVGERYVSTMIVNQDHFIPEVHLGGGRFVLDMQTFETPYVIAVVRTLVDAADPEDVAAVNALQDEMRIEAASSRPFVSPDYDEASFKGLVAAIIGMGPYVPDSFRMFGKREDVDPVRHFIGTAGGWGGLPESEAFYLNVEPRLPVGEYRLEVPADVPVGAFWSISLYNAQGFFEPNEFGAYNVNSVTGERNRDGSMTVHFGECGDERVNCLPIMEGWNYTVRLYRPEAEILDGSWAFPAAEPVE